MLAVFKHELAGYFRSLTAYIFCAFMLLFVGIGTMLYNIQAAVANFEYVLSFVSLGLVVIIPVLTMRSISEEKKQKTDQLLYTLPLSTARIVLGKYLALLVVFLIPICIIAVYPLVFSRYGEVYLLTSYGSLAAFYCMGAAMIAFGVFVSSLTENQGIAAGIAIPVLLFNYFSVTLAEYVSGTATGSFAVLCVLAFLLSFVMDHMTHNENLSYGISIVLILVLGVIFFVDSSVYEGLIPDIMKKLSLFERFYTIVNGVFDLTAIVYYLTVIVFFLFLTVQSLEKRRYN